MYKVDCIIFSAIRVAVSFLETQDAAGAKTRISWVPFKAEIAWPVKLEWCAYEEVAFLAFPVVIVRLEKGTYGFPPAQARAGASCICRCLPALTRVLHSITTKPFSATVPMIRKTALLDSIGRVRNIEQHQNNARRFERKGRAHARRIPPTILWYTTSLI